MGPSAHCRVLLHKVTRFWFLRLCRCKKWYLMSRLDQGHQRYRLGHKMGHSAHCCVLLHKLISYLDSWDWVLSKSILTCSNRTTGGWEWKRKSLSGWVVGGVQMITVTVWFHWNRFYCLLLLITDYCQWNPTLSIFHNWISRDITGYSVLKHFRL